jgi:phosphoserine aminotransferase
MAKRVYNYSAGPGVLPESVLREVQEEMLDYRGHGLSVMEMSHRSPVYQSIIDNAINQVKKLMEIDNDYEVLFLQGGASTQFLMIPMNFCADDKVANYINTGAWSTKAIAEARKIGKKVHVSASSEDKDFTYIPKDFTLSENPAYLHITTNNTIRGTEYKYIPKVPAGVPIIADMSSDIFSKPVDFKRFDVIYAGAQKNMGPAGVTLVVIKKTMLEKIQKNLPTMLDYNTHVAKGSMFNTPPTFAIYVVGKVLGWIEEMGGLEAIEKRNIKKADYMFNIFDSSDFYRGTVVPEDRSLMNIPFRLPNEELEKKFLKEATENGFLNIKGHRSVGGCRVSLYNSLPMKAAEDLAEFMIEFEKNNQ